MPQPLFLFEIFQVALFCIEFLRSSSINKKLQVVFHFIKIEVVFHFPKNWGCLTFEKTRSLPFLKIWGHLPFSKIEVVFHFQKNWGRLPFSNKLRLSSIFKKLRSSSIFKNIEVVFHISSSWVKIRLHTKNQLPRLSRTALIVIIPGVGWAPTYNGWAATYNEWAATYNRWAATYKFFLPIYNTTPGRTRLELTWVVAIGPSGLRALSQN